MQTLINPDRPNVDIVLVHGLNVWSNPTHAEKTWIAETPEGGVHWVRDFLPLHEETSRARVLVFPYNACAVFGAAATGVVAQAENMLNRLWLDRRGVTSRPLIFIAHSLGGILVKEALVQARNSGGKFASIWYFTTGIVFFGTPHRGVDTSMYQIMANVFATLSSNPDPGFLESLNQYGSEAERLHGRFSALCHYFQFISVYETRPHKISSLGVIVPRLSALLGLEADRETRIPLDRDHNQVCKFSSEDDEGFRAFFPNFRTLYKKAVSSFNNPTNFPHREELATAPISPLDDDRLPIEQVMAHSRSLLESRQTTSAVANVDGEISVHRSATSSFVTVVLIPCALAVASLLTILLAHGPFLQRFLVQRVLNMVDGLVGSLDDIHTEQSHVLNLSMLSIRLLYDRLHGILVAKGRLEAHPGEMGLELAAGARDLLTRLDIQSEQLVEELHKRQQYAEAAGRRVRETDDFRKELIQAREREGQDESWLVWLVSLLGRLLKWLYHLVAEIGRVIIEVF